MTITIRGLSKRYGATLALDDLDLEIRPGEVHALLGHNGAGKSTVIGCLGGSTAPTAGTVTIDGVKSTGYTPRGSIDAGVAVIYQHLSLIDGLSVADNLFLGHEHTAGGVFLKRRERARLAQVALDRVRALSRPSDLVSDLSIGQRQLVEIAKALQRDAKLLILDEPSAALSPIEARTLAGLVEDLKAQGIAILYVTHLLEEVMRLADRVTVLRGGRKVWSADQRGFTKRDLVDAISDARVAMPERRERPDLAGPPALSLERFSGPGLGPIDLAVHPGEIVALYGLIGSSRTRLLEMLFGARRHTGGTVRVDGAPVKTTSPASALAAQIALVPGDRKRLGLFGSLSASENVVVHLMREVSRWGFRNRRSERGVFDESASHLSLRPLEPGLAAERFSGGNQQKLLFARWMNGQTNVRALLLDDPTQGVDVGARAEIYDVVRQFASTHRAAVLFASNEPEEVLALAHRIILVSRGQVIDEIDVDDTTEEHLLDRIHSQHLTA